MDADTLHELQRMSRSRSLPRRAVRQPRALVLAASGVPNAEIARRYRITDDTVRAWRQRFAREGLAGIGRIAPGRGRKPSVSAATERAVVRETLRAHEPPRLTAAGLGRRFRISAEVVKRIWRDFGVTPQR